MEATSIGLAIYFAERNKGAYHNLFMTFSEKPEFVRIQGTTLTEKVHFISQAYRDMNTNLEAALLKILTLATKNHCSQEELPQSLIIVSDMEIDYCATQNQHTTFYDHIARLYKNKGYQMPSIIFWNVNSRHDTFLADKTNSGMQLVSGQSASVFKHLISLLDEGPTEMMYEVLNGERYQCVTLS